MTLLSMLADPIILDQCHSQPKDLASMLAISESDARRLIDIEPSLSSHSARRLKRTLKELSAALHVSAG